MGLACEGPLRPALFASKHTTDPKYLGQVTYLCRGVLSGVRLSVSDCVALVYLTLT